MSDAWPLRSRLLRQKRQHLHLPGMYILSVLTAKCLCFAKDTERGPVTLSCPAKARLKFRAEPFDHVLTACAVKSTGVLPSSSTGSSFASQLSDGLSSTVRPRIVMVYLEESRALG